MTRDAVYQPLERRIVEEIAQKRGIPFDQAAATLGMQRETFLKQIADDPYTNGYEPDIWLIVKALLRGLVITREEQERVKAETGLDWDEWARRTREALGFSHMVNELLIMGANRSGKTDFMAKAVWQVAMRGKKLIKVGFQELKTGKEVQMKRMWHYTPNEIKKKNIALKKATDIHEHVSYSEANGFAGSRIVLKNASNIDFITYKMDVKAALEGSEDDVIWLDEEEPKSFVDAARGRTASRSGSVVLTFTPVSGYNYGAKKYMRVRQAYWFTVKLGAIIMGVAAFVLVPFAPWIITFFRNDPEVIKIGTLALRFQAIALPLHAFIVGTNMLMQSTGKIKSATFLSMNRQGVYFIPAILILPHFLGLTGVEISQAVADFLSVFTAIPYIIWFFKGLEKNKLQ